MKEPNYSQLRSLISATKQGKVLQIMHDYSGDLGLDPEVFDMVFEGFWDIYTFKPRVLDVSGKKMVTWIPKVNLRVNKTTAKVEEPEEGDEENSANAEIEKLNAIVRIRIPKKQPEQEEDEDGNPIVN
jgi:lauroyl/myristoyl acyltransferase